jgi:hypothetical protein
MEGWKRKIIVGQGWIVWSNDYHDHYMLTRMGGLKRKKAMEAWSGMSLPVAVV